jgi:CheY-like chemotaxis protein
MAASDLVCRSFKRLVDAHHGTITADSPGLGRGATFTVRLPIDAAPTRSVRPAVVPSESAHAETPSLDDLSVLVVDDDEESRFVVAEHLSSQGARVIGAASAAEAYDVLRRERVDVLLADIAMPEEDGYTLIRRVRGGLVPMCTSIPAAALTAFAREDDRQLALRAGFQMHLVKPVDADALFAAVAMLGRQAAMTDGETRAESGIRAGLRQRVRFLTRSDLGSVRITKGGGCNTAHAQFLKKLHVRWARSAPEIRQPPPDPDLIICWCHSDAPGRTRSEIADGPADVLRRRE